MCLEESADAAQSCLDTYSKAKDVSPEVPTYEATCLHMGNPSRQNS